MADEDENALRDKLRSAAASKKPPPPIPPKKPQIIEPLPSQAPPPTPARPIQRPVSPLPSTSIAPPTPARPPRPVSLQPPPHQLPPPQPPRPSLDERPRTPARSFRNLSPQPGLLPPRSTSQTSIRSLHRDGSPQPPQQPPRSRTPARSQTNPLPRFPKGARISRRLPFQESCQSDINTRSSARRLAVWKAGLVLTIGSLTKAWDLSTGQEKCSWLLKEHVKSTAVAPKHGEDGKAWVGLDSGEVFEIEHETGMSYPIRPSHLCRVIAIHGHDGYMATADIEGNMLIWQKDLSQSSFRFPFKPGLIYFYESLVWITHGKGVWLFHIDFAGGSAKLLSSVSLMPHNMDKITAAAVLPSQPDCVYFGHSHGEVSIWSYRKGLALLESKSVGTSRITSLLGYADFLWIGKSNGKIQVFEISHSGWRQLKDFKAYDDEVVSINLLEIDSVAKHSLPVVTLGSFSAGDSIRIWDGLLQKDWLAANLREHESEFCIFHEVTASILTWNIGASKPSALWHNPDDSAFFRQYLKSFNTPPDILVFGLQELVDLEDKKQTAKSFFKGIKKSSSAEHEKLSHQYRVWQDHVTRAIDEHLSQFATYQVLQTAELVGLFTLILVKDSIRPHISRVDKAQVKLGFHGMHGNKGALLVRCLLNDSSLIFLNCHLAAGQDATQHRNENARTVIDASPLPAEMDKFRLINCYSENGGDGSMVLDHDFAILNGDLNYRIASMTKTNILAALDKNNLARLLERDQLLQSRAKYPHWALREFAELPVTFAPTYKFDIGTDTYDTSEKQRTPAWCDRILVKGRGVKSEAYKSWPTVRISDHRPVSLFVKLPVRTVRTDGTYEKCWDEGWKRLSGYKQEFLSVMRGRLA
jgi:endonuclease/exonuclease/phosphatase family metal-dependent hydrolase